MSYNTEINKLHGLNTIVETSVFDKTKNSVGVDRLFIPSY